MKNTKRAMTLVSGAFMMAAFQNCAPADFSGSSSDSSKATVGTASVPDILGQFDFKDIVEIDFSTTLNAMPFGTIKSKTVTLLNMTAQTFDTVASFSAPPNISSKCEFKGSKIDFSLLEKNLKAIKLSSTQSLVSPIPDIGEAVLTIILRDGQKKELKLNSKTSSVDIDGLPEITAPDLSTQLKDLALESSCSLAI